MSIKSFLAVEAKKKGSELISIDSCVKEKRLSSGKHGWFGVYECNMSEQS